MAVREFDLIVIGSGSGLDVGVAAAESGLKVAIIEKGPMGGTCLNRGCIPSKMLIHSADIVEAVEMAPIFGVKVKGYEIDFPALVKRVSNSVDNDSNGIEEAFKQYPNPVLFKKECRFAGPKTLQVGDEVIKAEKILISSGTRPYVPPIKGLEGTGFMTSDEALRLTSQPKELTIIGGGYIAAELAHFFGSLGTIINVVSRTKVLLAREDEEIAGLFTHLMSHRYNIFTGYEPITVSKKDGIFEITIQSTDKNPETKTLHSDQLLVAAGRIPNSDILDLPKTGVVADGEGYVMTDGYMETNVKGIFALGDAVGRYPFKHVANYEAEIVYHNLLNPDNKTQVDYTAMPHAIFTSPQIASVGKTEQELKTSNTDYIIGRWNYINTGMGEAIEDQTGFVKFLLERNTMKILGCHIIGTYASSLIHEVLVAMKLGGTAESIRGVVHIHPALSEVVKKATEYLYDPKHVHVHEHEHENAQGD